eukprot:Blabericola_migrator_1__10941@NODE_632_length_7151_cov_76_464286_g463_i0_p2_GENE_NODE_632_length_7151_cov_76_464286_g463_i0NODE_632_length_7151_cov_76_464286_g463_i0_p2_ORF_typecomplete_len663_score91_30_NODE_632_length_7151_cov_76_464286_g463_i08442832
MQQRLRRVRFVPLTSRVLGGCHAPVDYTVQGATQRLTSEFMHNDTHAYALFWVVCQNFFRVMRLDLDLPESIWAADGGDEDLTTSLDISDRDIFNASGGEEVEVKSRTGSITVGTEILATRTTFVDWMTESNSEVSIASTSSTVRGKEGINTWYFLANLTDLGPTLKVCDAYNPDLWVVNLNKIKEWRCRTTLLTATQVPTSLAVAPDQKSLMMTIHLRGIVSLGLEALGCTMCGNPHFHHKVEHVLSRYDGIIGDPYLSTFNPSICAFDNYGDILYFVDGSDGFLRWTLWQNDPTIITPAELLWHPHDKTRKAPRSVGRSTHLNKLVMLDWTGQHINYMSRHPENMTLTLDALVNTSGNPFDLDATVSENKVFWSEPAQNRLCRAVWGTNVKDELTEQAKTWLYGKTIAGVMYSSYFDRVFTASPRAGEILSFSHVDPTESPIVHFNSRHSDALSVRYALRPLYLAVDDNFGSLYFNVLSAPNVSAYTLDSPEKFVTQEDGVWYRVPEGNRTEESIAANSGYNLASTIWLMKKRPFSTSLLYPPQPFYTSANCVILSITRNDDWLVFAETSQEPGGNFTARIGRLPLLSTTGETFAMTWRVRVSCVKCADEKWFQEPHDVSLLLDWSNAIPNTVFAPIGGKKTASSLNNNYPSCQSVGRGS